MTVSDKKREREKKERKITPQDERPVAQDRRTNYEEENQNNDLTAETTREREQMYLGAIRYSPEPQTLNHQSKIRL